MRNTFLLALSSMALSLGLASSALAADADTTTNSNAKVIVYASPEGKNVLTKVDPNKQLVWIYHKGDWIKVGNPKNGKIGWINIKQYQQARIDYFQPDLKAVYVHMDQDPKTGKRTLSVVAFKKGKKLSDKDAKTLYKNLQKQEREEADQTANVANQADSAMEQELQSIQQE